MQAYRTTCTKENTPTKIVWHGSKNEASKARTAAKREGYTAVSQVVQVPTNKTALLEFLNNNS